MAVVIEYDETIPALYIWLNRQPIAFTESLDDQRHVDFAADGTPVGVELLYPDLGIDLTGLPHADEVAKMLEQYGVPHPQAGTRASSQPGI